MLSSAWKNTYFFGFHKTRAFPFNLHFLTTKGKTMFLCTYWPFISFFIGLLLRSTIFFKNFWAIPSNVKHFRLALYRVIDYSWWCSGLRDHMKFWQSNLGQPHALYSLYYTSGPLSAHFLIGLFVLLLDFTSSYIFCLIILCWLLCIYPFLFSRTFSI